MARHAITARLRFLDAPEALAVCEEEWTGAMPSSTANLSVAEVERAEAEPVMDRWSDEWCGWYDSGRSGLLDRLDEAVMLRRPRGVSGFYFFVPPLLQQAKLTELRLAS
mmetsp:Transcript_13510/g.38659  ORF Transcript_13510/g.38659 Transcript_13510/m.38659 type:complete len:109 (-) Transcript_13510:146-472(-)